MHFLLILFNKPNLFKSASIDHKSFACYFSRFFERCDVIVTHYFMKVKCFYFRTLPKLAPYRDSICCYCGSAAEESKAVFIRNCDGAQDARDIAYNFDDEK